MSTVAKETGADFKPVSEGSHLGICFQIIDLGTQDSPTYPASHKIMIGWEIPGETIKIDDQVKPMVVSGEYTLNLSTKSNLRALLKNWRGRDFTPEELKGFDIKNVCGAPCLLSIVHKTSSKGKTRAVVTGAMKLPQGLTAPQRFNDLVKYDIEEGESETFKKLPKWIQEKIRQSHEFKYGGQPEPETTHSEVPPEEDDESSVPF